jgi:hypothetical protein
MKPTAAAAMNSQAAENLLETSNPLRKRLATAIDSATSVGNTADVVLSFANVEEAAEFIKLNCQTMLSAARSTGRLLYRGEPVFGTPSQLTTEEQIALSSSTTIKYNQQDSGIAPGQAVSSPALQSSSSSAITTKPDLKASTGSNLIATATTGAATSTSSNQQPHEKKQEQPQQKKLSPLLLSPPPDLLSVQTYGSNAAVDFFTVLSDYIEKQQGRCCSIVSLHQYDQRLRHCLLMKPYW